MTIDTISELDDRELSKIGSVDSSVSLKEREEQEAARKTQRVALSALQKTETPSSFDPSLKGRAAVGPVRSVDPKEMSLIPDPKEPVVAVDPKEPIPEVDPKETQAAIDPKELPPVTDSDWELSPEDVLDFPPLAWEAIRSGLEKEKQSTDQINGHIKTAENHQKNIDLLLDFSTELTSKPENSTELTEKMKSQLAELKARGIDLWKTEGASLTKERYAELKSLTSARIEKERSDLQILFTTKIQVVIQNIGSIMETLKDIMRNHTRLMGTITGNSRGR